MNLSDIRARLQQLNRRTSKANDIWKPKDEHVVRLLPYPHGSDPFLELYFHYEIGENPPILCPKANFGEECEICDFCEQLRAWKDPEGNDKPEHLRKEDFELFKKIQAKARVFVPMVERGKEGDGPKFWGVTPNQAQQILEVCADGDRLEACGVAKDDDKNALKVLFDPDSAFDLQVSYAKPGEKGNNKTFTQITIKGKIKATPLLSDKKARAELVAGVKDIKEVYPKVHSSEVSKMFQKFVNGGANEAKPSGGTEKYSDEKPTSKKEDKPAPSNTKENAAKAGTRSIDEAFGDLMDEN